MIKKVQPRLMFPLCSLAVIASVFVACGDYPVAGILGNTTGASTTENTSGGSELPANTAELPCAVLGDAGHECVSAHSTVRVIVPDYTGPLYQIDNGTENGFLDIPSKDGYADPSAQAAFCTAGCTIRIIYDQSGYNNHLTVAPPGSKKNTPGFPVPADRLPVQINGRSVYGILIRPQFGYRASCNDCPYPEDFKSAGVAGIPVGDEPETIYMVSSALDTNNGCCFDYGNASITSENDGNGTMEAVYIGEGVVWGKGGGDGPPWVMNDMENGLFPGWDLTTGWLYKANTTLVGEFVTGIVVGDTQEKNDGKGRFALYGGDATSPELLEKYDGIRPVKPGYVPMQKQGSVILGIGGDNSNTGTGRFYEGVIAKEAATIDTVKALQKAIADAGYGK